MILNYVLDQQIGYQLRLANQRHLEIFGATFPDITPTQFSVLVRLHERGELSQNHLGREVAMDTATVKGVVSRLKLKQWVDVGPHPTDRRRLVVSLTSEGRNYVEQAVKLAASVSKITTANLTTQEARRLLQLLNKI
jgi:MarR family transcriptional regulator, lower aerobic nicotinate degradation pathway regulator